MENSIDLILDEANEKYNSKNYSEALGLFKKVLDKSRGQCGPAFFGIGMILLSRKIYPAALEMFIQSYKLKHKTKDVMDMVNENYYNIYENKYRQRYEDNVNALINYKYILNREFPKFTELKLIFLPYQDFKYIIFDKCAQDFIAEYDIKKRPSDINICKVREILIIKDEITENNILEYLEKTRDPEPYLWAKLPLYLYYEDFGEFAQFLQVIDLTKVLESQRVVFLFGEDDVKNWFDNPQAILPQRLIATGQVKEDIKNYIFGLYKKREITFSLCSNEVNSYYDKLSIEKVLNRLREKNARILFITSRFSTAVQYFIRDCILACEKLGIPCKLAIEDSDIHRLDTYSEVLLLEKFKPDIIFIIDHFRWEYSWIPQNVLFITWIQDPLPHIMSKDSAAKIKEKDFILNLFYSGKEFNDLGYPENKLIDTPIPVNTDIYKSYVLTDKERAIYETDICAFSNGGNPLKGLDNFLKQFNSLPNFNMIKKPFESAFKEIYEMALKGKFLYTPEQYAEVLKKWLYMFNINIDNKIFRNIASSFRNEIGFRILRSVPLEWLHAKGYNMKIWGGEWLDHQVLKIHAQGVAENGEVLSRIINASKIVIGTNPGLTTHPRVFETMLSDSFYLGVNIPEEYDWANIRRFMVEDEEIVFFYNREDLYKKVDYYLNHEDERKRIIENGKKKILEKLTFEAMMKNMLKEIGERLEKQVE